MENNDKGKKNDLQMLNLSGKVKSLKQFNYKAIEKFGDVEKGERDNHFLNKEEWDTGYVFNEHGYLSSISWYQNENSYIEYPKKTEIPEKSNSIFDYLASSSGREVYINLQCSKLYDYNDKGQLREINTSDKYGRLQEKQKFEYDEKGNLKIKNTYLSNGSLKENRTFKYNKKGVLVEENIYNTFDKAEPDDIIIYDKDGNRMDRWGNKFDNDSLVFDDKGNTVERIFSNYENKRISLKYQYEFDEIENWVKRTEYLNGVPSILTERIIEYHGDSNNSSNNSSPKTSEEIIGRHLEKIKEQSEKDSFLNAGFVEQKVNDGVMPSCYNFSPRIDKSIDNKLSVYVGGGTDVVIKLMDKSTEKCIRYVFINSKSFYDIKNIPEGIYYLKIAYGKEWYSKIENGNCIGKFLRNPLYSMGDEILDFTITKTRQEISIPSYRLQLDVISSNFNNSFNSHSISEEQFNN